MIIKNDVHGRSRFSEDVLEWDRCYINKFEITEDRDGNLVINDHESMSGKRMAVMPNVSNEIVIVRVDK